MVPTKFLPDSTAFLLASQNTVEQPNQSELKAVSDWMLNLILHGCREHLPVISQQRSPVGREAGSPVGVAEGAPFPPHCVLKVDDMLKVKAQKLRQGEPTLHSHLLFVY